MKKTILLKESELIRLIESTVTDMQEQTIQSGYYQGMSVDQMKNYAKELRGGTSGFEDYEAGKARLKLKEKYNATGGDDRARAIAEMIFNGGKLNIDDLLKHYDQESFATGKLNISISPRYHKLLQDTRKTLDWQLKMRLIKKYGEDYEITDADIKWYYDVGQKWVDEYVVWIEEGRKGFCDNILHCVLPILEIAALFIPVVGVWISMGIGLIDATIYYHEGDKEMAGLVGFLSILPGIGQITKRLGLTQAIKVMGKEGLEKLSRKALNNPQSLNKLDQYMLKSIGDNKALINKYVSKDLAQQLKNSGKLLPKTPVVKSIMNATLLYGGAGVGAVVTHKKIASKGHMGPKELLKTRGLEPKNKISAHKIVNLWPQEASTQNPTYWEFFNYMFKSDKTLEDGEKMVQALLKGQWDPLGIWGGSRIVPKEYRTKKYNKWATETVNNEEIQKTFMSDGSTADNNKLLEFITVNTDWTPEYAIPPEYQTETFKEYYANLKTQEDTYDKELEAELDQYDW